MHLTSFTSIILLFGYSSAFIIPSTSNSKSSFSDYNPVKFHRHATTHKRQAAAAPNPAAVATLLKIVPRATTCDAGAQFAPECITATDAVNPILSSFQQFGISTAPEQGALLAWMALESGEFKFNTHHFPSENPGQGTRNMMSPTFVTEYATEVKISTAGGPAATLATLNKDNTLSFGSAAWFYTRKCSDDIKAAVRTGSQAGFERFTTECIGTTVTDDRLKYWRAAAGALSFA